MILFVKKIRLVLIIQLILVSIVLKADPPASCPCEPDDPGYLDCTYMNASLCGVDVPINQNLYILIILAVSLGVIGLIMKNSSNKVAFEKML